MSYTVESHWNYGADERYNAGRGLSAFKETLPEAEHLFAICAKEQYSVDIIDNKTLEVVKHHGPPTRDALRSMNAAWQRGATIYRNKALP